MEPKIVDQHRWLQKLLGQWNVQSDHPESGQVFQGTETFHSIGDAWVVGEGHGSMPGAGDMASMITIGFDPDRQRFVSTWIGSMMTFLWVSEGTLDPGGTTLTLECEGPSFTETGKMERYRDVIEFKDDDYRTLAASVLGTDGKWNQFMTTHYRRAT